MLVVANFIKTLTLRHLLFISCILLALQSNGQRFVQKLTGGFSVPLGIPSGEFGDVNKNAAIGIRGQLMYNPSREVPVYLGLELGFSTMGSDTRYFYDSWFDEYEINASSNIFTILFKMRIQKPSRVAVRPFAEGLIGWNDFFSSVNVTRTTTLGPGFNNQTGNSSDASWAMTFGGGAGLDIRLNKEGNVWLEVKTSYMIGRKAKYYTDPRILSNGEVQFNFAESTTNMVIPQVGVRFGL